jgi:rhodanese-related sulfurtransferase
MPLSAWIKQTGLLCVCALLLAIALAVIAPQKFPLFHEGGLSTKPAAGAAASATALPEFEIASPGEAQRLFEEGHVLFVDARASDDFARGHIPGAISLPIGEFEADIKGFRQAHALTQPIVTYCSGRLCQDSHELAQRLMEQGYTDVKVFIDGFPGWEAEGYPVEAD